jgi:hypothetical protein
LRNDGVCGSQIESVAAGRAFTHRAATLRSRCPLSRALFLSFLLAFLTLFCGTTTHALPQTFAADYAVDADGYGYALVRTGPEPYCIRRIDGTTGVEVARWTISSSDTRTYMLWSPKSIAIGSDGKPRLLWAKGADIMIWRFSQSLAIELKTTFTAPLGAGWAAVDLTLRGTDSYVLFSQTGTNGFGVPQGKAGLFTVLSDTTSGSTSSSGWMTNHVATRIATAANASVGVGTVQILWSIGPTLGQFRLWGVDPTTLDLSSPVSDVVHLCGSDQYASDIATGLNATGSADETIVTIRNIPTFPDGITVVGLRLNAGLAVISSTSYSLASSTAYHNAVVFAGVGQSTSVRDAHFWVDPDPGPFPLKMVIYSPSWTLLNVWDQAY